VIELTKRDQQVLEAVVIDYIETGEPVGSRTISKNYALLVSPATIRNVMADLEEMGFLYQPHTSAGRIPTEKGLRFYLDSIIRFKAVENRERTLIRQALQQQQMGVKELLQRTSRILSRFCRQAGVVLWQNLSAIHLKQIEFICLRPNQILVIIISKSGLVHHRLLDLEGEVKQEELDKYTRYLNDLLQDMTLEEAKRRIIEEMRNEKVLFDQLSAKALEITQRFFQSTLELSSIYIEGQTNLFNNPEFAHVAQMRRLLEAFEDKSRIIRLLDMTLERSKGVQTILGSESDLQELREISLISSPYRRGNTHLGVLGVIGPLRMDYSRIIPLVEFTADLLNEMLDEPDQEV
jgi:heat-inducible transcriptional repressor